MKNIAIIGGNGAIGSALIKQAATSYPNAHIHAFSRTQSVTDNDQISHHLISYDEQAIALAADQATTHMTLDMVIVTIGMLYDELIKPEKSLKELSADKLQRLFSVNTILPALIAKYFTPKLTKENRSVFAALSARVGSISDNKLGGWYSYRASKAALNMILKNTAIEMRRSNRNAIIVGLHPGTVDSNLSKPFQKNVPPEKLFSAELAAEKLMDVIQRLTVADSGHCFAWDGKEIEP